MSRRRNQVCMRRIGRKIDIISIALYAGKKCWFVQGAARFFRRHRCLTLLEPFAGSAVIGLSLLWAGIIQRLILVEKDHNMSRLLEGMRSESDLANRYYNFKPTRANVAAIRNSDPHTAFSWLVRCRTSSRGKPYGGMRPIIDERWCRDLVTSNLRRVYEMRDRITVIQGDALFEMQKYAGDRSVGCFADPPYTADKNSKGKGLYKHHNLNHAELFATLAHWRGPWLMTNDNSPRVRRLVRCYGMHPKSMSLVSTTHRWQEFAITRRDYAY